MITSKQRSFLRSMAHNIDPVVYIGKLGVTGNVEKELDNCLETRELVKFTLYRESKENKQIGLPR